MVVLPFVVAVDLKLRPQLICPGTAYGCYFEPFALLVLREMNMNGST